MARLSLPVATRRSRSSRTSVRRRRENVSESCIRLNINRIGGDTLQFDVQSHCTVANLKDELHRRVQIPPILQVLLLDAASLSDDSTLQSFLTDCEPCLTDSDSSCSLSLTLLVSCNPDLKNASMSRIQEFVDAIAERGRCTGTQWSSNAVASLIEHNDPDVRQVALETLGSVAARGDEWALSAVNCALEDRSSFVRRSSIKLMQKIADKGDQDVLSFITQRLHHDNPGVRHDAVDALASMAERGDSHSIGCLMKCLEDDDWGVRAAAVRGVARVAEAKDTVAMQALADRARLDPEPKVCVKAARAVQKFAGKAVERE